MSHLSDDLGAGAARYALISRVERFCEGTETSTPYAHLYAAYQVGGVVKYVESVTGCADFPSTTPTGTVVGEQLTLLPDPTMPLVVAREDGARYDVGLVSQLPWVWYLDKHLFLSASDKAAIDVRHKTELLGECNALGDATQKDNCLYFYNQL